MEDLRMTLKLGSLQAAVDAALDRLNADRLVPRIWARDHTVWKSDPTEIANRLGWLTVAEEMTAQLPRLTQFADDIRHEGTTDVVLLGMGGSSLGPEVLRRTFGSAKGYPRLHVLDSTVPASVREVTRAIRPAKTLFLVASKSGGTIEVMSLYAHFRQVIAAAKGNGGGKQFVAITDPGTGLGAMATEHGFRTTFENPPDIGGRYSVLSYFGLVPAALAGIDIATLLGRAREMAASCGAAVASPTNPGAILGAVMGTLARQGRDKVTLITSPKIKSYGLWTEQLLAESTGKEGVGLIPIAEEPPGMPACYGADRLFVYLRLNGDANTATDRHVRALERAGHPTVKLVLRDRYDLGAEFFRWEFATAVAGQILSIHPFNQPNVQESKENTAAILDHVKTHRRLPELPPDGTLTDLLAQAGPGKYLAILAYVGFSSQADAAIRTLRRRLLTRYKLATTAGYGPRYLHSTGQLHKGGPNSGLFLELIDAMQPDLPVPNAPYSFGMLAQAQAVGDFQSLLNHRCPVVRVQLGHDGAAHIATLGQAPRAPRSSKTTADRRAKRPAKGRGKRVAKNRRGRKS